MKKRKDLGDLEKEIAKKSCIRKTKESLCETLNYNDEVCKTKTKQKLCDELEALQNKLVALKTEEMKDNLIKQGDCITQIAELNTKIKLLKEKIASYELGKEQELLKFKTEEEKKKQNDKYLCEMKKSDVYIDELEEQAKKYNEGYEAPGLGGGSNSNTLKEQLNAILSGGIIPKLKKKYSKMLKDEYKLINAIRGGGQVGGNPTLILFNSVVKIFFMTVGTFIFDWWPVVVVISLYCAYLEYSMLAITDTEIVGLDGLSILFACACPCCWTGFRLYKGWKTQLNTETDNLWTIMKSCSPYLSMPLTEIKSSSCEGTKCYIMSPECYKSVYETEKEYSGFFGSSDDGEEEEE